VRLRRMDYFPPYIKPGLSVPFYLEDYTIVTAQGFKQRIDTLQGNTVRYTP
jgi:hypothetical protein